jgi:hypothetical protein
MRLDDRIYIVGRDAAGEKILILQIGVARQWPAWKTMLEPMIRRMNDFLFMISCRSRGIILDFSP